MPHLLHMIAAGVAAVIIFFVTLLLVVASCDLNPVSRGWMSSPAAYTRLKILCAKAVYVISSSCLQSVPRAQTMLMVISAAIICWWNFKSVSGRGGRADLRGRLMWWRW